MCPVDSSLTILKLIDECLFDPPAWMHVFRGWWWLPVFVIGFCALLSAVRVGIIITQDETSHIAFGWMRGRSRANNKLGRAGGDYRLYVVLLQIIGTIGIAWILLKLWTVRPMLSKIGVSDGTVWNLSPYGVDLLKSMIWVAWVGCWLWALASTLMCIILWIDPYGWHRIRLTPLEKVKWIDPKSDKPEDWPKKRTKNLFVKHLYFSPDGDTCSIKEQPEWINLEWKKKKGRRTKERLEGPGDDHYFKAGSPASGGKVERGDVFYVGTLDRKFRFH